MSNTIKVQDFRGLRNDKGKKFIDPDYLSDIENFNFDDIVGMNTILYPELVYNGSGSYDVDGIFEYNYLDEDNVLQKEKIAVINGVIYKNWDTTPTALKSGLNTGKCDFRTYQDKLFIANGKNFPQVYDGVAVYEMGAPRAKDSFVAGNLDGTYFYEINYVDSGGEKRIGTVSNTVTVSNSQVTLTIPRGWSDVTSRKIYRTVDGGATTKLVATISDNSTTTYTDNVADGSLSTDQIGVNKEYIRPYFLEVSNEKILGTKISKYPTQVHVTEANIEVWDTSAYVNVSNVSNDNTQVTGALKDYSKVIVSTERKIYALDLSGSTVSTSVTRSNVGVKNGYTMVNVPAQDEFIGGIMFVSTLNDVRVFNGNYAQPIATSLDNLNTENFSQVVRGTLKDEIIASSDLHAEFHDYKYHLAVNEYIYVYEIRGLKWTKYKIETDSYSSVANVLGVVDSDLYIGQKDADIIEKMYESVQYRSERVTSKFSLAQLFEGKQMKYFDELMIYINPSTQNKYKITITVEDNYDDQIVLNVDEELNAFDRRRFNENAYATSKYTEDYRIIHINKYGRWIDIDIETDYPFYFRGFEITPEYVNNA